MATEQTATREERISYTPGPWEYWPAGNYDGFAIAPKGTLPTLASVERCGLQLNVQAHNFPGSTEANARLIAAAPDLLVALKGLIEHEESIGLACAWAVKHARAMVAKAEGRS